MSIGVISINAKISFFERPFPSANSIMINGAKPTLIDTGFGSDYEETLSLMNQAGLSPEDIKLIVNTHYHTDHTGGNNRLQKDYGIPIAAHLWEGDLINRRDQEACAAEWLDQPIEPYHVDHLLKEGDEIDCGEITLQAIHTPGHTLGHLSFYAPEQRIMISGDIVQQHDVGWINMFREGVGAVQRSLESLEKLAKYNITIAYPGHGPALHHPQEAIEKAMKRYEKWLNQPEKMAWHGCKRIFAYALMIRHGIHRDHLHHYLLNQTWFLDYSRNVFHLTPEEFVEPFINEILRSGAGEWQNHVLVAKMPHRSPKEGWIKEWVFPRHWD